MVRWAARVHWGVHAEPYVHTRTVPRQVSHTALRISKLREKPSVRAMRTALTRNSPATAEAI